MTRPPTQAQHAGADPDPATGALNPPLHRTTTYAQRAPNDHQGYTYTRQANPTVERLEDRLATLEDADECVAFKSGMAAIDALLRTHLTQGDHVVVSEVAYGGTTRLIDTLYEPYGIDATYADATDEAALADAVRPETQLVLLETPANPTLELADLQAAARITGTHGIPLAVDNTFLTPLGQDVFDLGADISLHSTTKLIDGHNATVGGAINVQDDPLLPEDLRFIRKTAGTNQSPDDAWRTLQGSRTLPLRLEAVTENAQAIAEHLHEHPAVDTVHYPGLDTFPQRKLATTQHDHHGPILAFELEAGYDAAKRIGQHFTHIHLAEHLGTSQTLLTHPASMTHAYLPDEERERLGITPGLLRLSAGLEDPRDLLEDLDQALDQVTRGGSD